MAGNVDESSKDMALMNTVVSTLPLQYTRKAFWHNVVCDPKQDFEFQRSRLRGDFYDYFAECEIGVK